MLMRWPGSPGKLEGLVVELEVADDRVVEPFACRCGGSGRRGRPSGARKSVAAGGQLADEVGEVLVVGVAAGLARAGTRRSRARRCRSRRRSRIAPGSRNAEPGAVRRAAGGARAAACVVERAVQGPAERRWPPARRSGRCAGTPASASGRGSAGRPDGPASCRGFSAVCGGRRTCRRCGPAGRGGRARPRRAAARGRGRPVRRRRRRRPCRARGACSTRR